ncbi:MAG: LON peptidase substrate-binding domain-containing protein [Planctomycetia bacterium]|nr:LON peptidase substrate-binding domain-containing protein [Planctomycetia bacterium]
MFLKTDLTLDPGRFPGPARLFPLPNLVLYPRIVQPLHVFEPRYRALMEAALDGDQLIALCVLAPGWENDYEGRPPLHPHACLGRIIAHTRLPDGRFNLLLAGLSRIEIVRELDPDKPFREAWVELRPDVFDDEQALVRPAVQRELLEVFQRVLPRVPSGVLGKLKAALEAALGGDGVLGAITDLAAYLLPQGKIDLKVQLLAEANVDRRAAMLLEKLRARDAARDLAKSAALKYPFPSSVN